MRTHLKYLAITACIGILAVADAVRAEPLTADETEDTLGWMIRKINQNMGLLR